MIHDLGVVIERVGESFWIRPCAVSEARIIRGNQMIAIGEPGEQWFEHSRRRRKSVQQKKCRGVFRTSLSVEDGKPIDLYRAIKSWVLHGLFLSSVLDLGFIDMGGVTRIPA